MTGVRTGGTPFTIRALRERGISRTALLSYLAMPATASWKTPPASVDEVVDQVDVGRLSRRPMAFDLRALDVMNRRQCALSGPR
jgi:glutamyl/glutaminyl-tRNA synthetase